jgi:hypothetical protein
MKVLNWWQALSWSQSALVLVCLVMLVDLIAILVVVSLPKRKIRIPAPTGDWKRNGPQAPGRFE